MHEVKVDVNKLLVFFDSNRSVRQHSSSIKNLAGEELLLAIMVDFFTRRGEKAELVSRKCTTGKRRGRQLDAWLRVEHKIPVGITHYQVEVKAWSGHGVGGGSRYLPEVPSQDDLEKYKKDVWDLYWKEGRFVDDGLNKVLTEMKKPEGASRVLPLACLWAPIHPDGLDNALFPVSPINSSFNELWVFSASSFLRQISSKERELVLQLPLLSERMRLLNELFSIFDKSQHGA